MNMLQEYVGVINENNVFTDYMSADNEHAGLTNFWTYHGMSEE